MSDLNSTVDVDIEIERGDFMLNAKFESDGGLTALFVRSGTGKTIIFECLA